MFRYAKVDNYNRGFVVNKYIFKHSMLLYINQMEYDSYFLFMFLGLGIDNKDNLLEKF